MVSGLKLLDIIESTHTLGDNKKERVLESIWVGFGEISPIRMLRRRPRDREPEGHCTKEETLGCIQAQGVTRVEWQCGGEAYTKEVQQHYCVSVFSPV